MKNTQTIIDHQKNEICLRLDALDNDQLQDEDAQRAIRALAMLGYEYQRPSLGGEILAGACLLATWAMLIMAMVALS